MFQPRFSHFLRIAILSSLLSAAASAATPPPLGSTPYPGGVTFRVWVPFVESVAVRINDRAPLPLAKEPGHPDAADTTWIVDAPDAKAGDTYKYLIRYNGNTAEFIDPR